MFKKPFKSIIVQITLLKPNRPVTLSFFFKEDVYVGLLLWYQLFKPLAVVDAPPLLSRTTDTITDPLFELIRARTDATDAKQ